MNEFPDALVIGAGPAGLMAAETLATAGRRVVVAEAMPTPARKFLMAGKSGLNLTKNEPLTAFRQNFSGSAAHAIGFDQPNHFGPQEVMDWAAGLGVELFSGSTGRVFPVGMKASPLLRRWLARLHDQGVELRTRWRWLHFQDGFRFSTPEGDRILRPSVTVLALGGASWPKLGSDGSWANILGSARVSLNPFKPANMGFRVEWSPQMSRFFGAAVKGVALHVGDQISRGEWVITRSGIEGGGLYQLGAQMRDGLAASVDLTPDLSHDALRSRFQKPTRKASVGNRLRRILGDPVKAALLLEWGKPWPQDSVGWTDLIKSLPIRHDGPMGITHAISTAGGVAGDAIAEDLQLKSLQGVFVAGEMLDWEAPTGGYLMTACLALGRRAGLGAEKYLEGTR